MSEHRRLPIDGFVIHDGSDCYVIAEIGHNHQGSVEQAKAMVTVAKDCGANAVKLQKRSNRMLYTREFFEQPYDNEFSFGPTYGEHREALELGRDDYVELQRYAREIGMTLFATPFDFESAVEAIRSSNEQLGILQCTAAYPCETEDLNLNVITTLRARYPGFVIGLSDHQNGISMALVAYMLGARVIEKHFTLNHAWKGTDHAFSLMPEGLRKLVRDLQRIPLALGDGVKRPLAVEAKPLEKMGKKLVAARDLEQGHVLGPNDVAIKSPADGGLPPYELDRLVGRRLRRRLAFEDFVTFDDVEPLSEHAGAHAAAQS